MTPARALSVIPEAPVSSTGPSFDARAADLIRRLREEGDVLRRLGNVVAADRVEYHTRQVEGMRNAMRAQDRGLDVRPTVTATERAGTRPCGSCGGLGHYAPTCPRRRR